MKAEQVKEYNINRRKREEIESTPEWKMKSILDKAMNHTLNLLQQLVWDYEDNDIEMMSQFTQYISKWNKDYN